MDLLSDETNFICFHYIFPVSQTEDYQEAKLSDNLVKFWHQDLDEEGQWHHLVLIFHRAGIMKNSSVSLFLDGEHVNTQKVSLLPLWNLSEWSPVYNSHILIAPGLAFSHVQFYYIFDISMQTTDWVQSLYNSHTWESFKLSVVERWQSLHNRQLKLSKCDFCRDFVLSL